MVVMVMILALTLSGCRENDNPDYMIDDWEHEDRLEFIDGLRDCYDSNWDKDYCYTIDDARYYTQEEVDALLYVIEHWAEMNDVQLEDMWEDIHDNWQQMEDTQEWCEDMSLDVPDDLGLLTSKECYDMIEWYGDNWEELYDLLNYMETLGQRIDELETQNEELERAIKLVAWEIDITNIMFGEFVGINAYGDCQDICITYAVIEVDGVEYETIPLPEYTYTMGERMIVLMQNGWYYSLPVETESE